MKTRTKGHVAAHKEDDGSDSDDESESERAHKQAGNGEGSKQNDGQFDEGEGGREVLSEEEEGMKIRASEFIVKPHADPSLNHRPCAATS